MPKKHPTVVRRDDLNPAQKAVLDALLNQRKAVAK